MIVRIPEIRNQNHETGFHHLETDVQNPKKNPSQKIEDPENIDQGQENEGIVIDQMIVGSEIEKRITKVIGEADQGPENNTEMRKGREVVAEKDVNPLRLRSTIFYSICAFGLLLSTHGRRTMEHGKQSITLT
jgi:hypothetical protein